MGLNQKPKQLTDRNMKLDFKLKSMVNVSIFSKEWLILGLVAVVFVNVVGLSIPNVPTSDFIWTNIFVLVSLYLTKGVATKLKRKKVVGR